MRYKGKDSEKRQKKFEANLKKLSQFGLQIETHLYEVGIVSNRKLVCYGE